MLSANGNNAVTDPKPPVEAGRGAGCGAGREPSAAPVRFRSSTADWPAGAGLVLTAIEAGQSATAANRRAIPRRRLRLTARLRLHSDAPQTTPAVVYTRNVHSRGLGFITPHRLPLGHGGFVDLPAEDGRVVTIPCTLLRCREAAPGWFEGSVYFNRDQPGFGG